MFTDLCSCSNSSPAPNLWPRRRTTSTVVRIDRWVRCSEAPACFPWSRSVVQQRRAVGLQSTNAYFAVVMLKSCSRKSWVSQSWVSQPEGGLVSGLKFRGARSSSLAKISYTSGKAIWVVRTDKRGRQNHGRPNSISKFCTESNSCIANNLDINHKCPPFW